MKADNSLSSEFLMHYPVEAARTLEQVSTEHVAALLSELPAKMVVPVMISMLAEKAAACLAAMDALSAARLLAELPVSSAARICRLLAPGKQDEIATHLSAKIQKKINRHMEYPLESVGTLLDPDIDIMPDKITVAEAIHRIERLDHAASCEIYIVDDSHHLKGMIDLGKLMKSSHHARLRDIMSHKIRPISTHANAIKQLAHPGWTTRRRLPVVERDNTLVGALDYNHLCNSVGDAQAISPTDPLDNLLSLASLYWLSVIQLLDSVLSMGKVGRGEDQ